MFIGLCIDPETNDLCLRDDNNLEFVYDAEAIGQHVRQRLKTFQGEWFLDTTAGVPWLDKILGYEYDSALAVAVVKAEILDTEGVTDITSFSVGFRRETRELAIRQVEILTIYDQEVSV